MKRYLFCIASLMVAICSHAQTPQGIPYQAMARNGSGVVIANTAIKVRFSIRDSIVAGAIKYQETHYPTTSALGLFSVNVGMGTVVSGIFSGINWGKNAKFMQVEMDPAGGTAYTDLGTTQMMSVPYALQTGGIKMKTSATGDTLYTGNGAYLIIPGLSAVNPILNQTEAPITDIDGNVYQTVRIGTQVWMKENLKVSKYRDGSYIPTNFTDLEWQNATIGVSAIYGNNAANNTTYGKLYNWYAVADAKGLCPVGWHVPSDADWKKLEIYLGMGISDADLTGERGGVQNVGGKLKSTSLWSSPNTGATNESGLFQLPGGYRESNGTYYYLGVHGHYWAADAATTGAWRRGLNNIYSSSYRDSYGKSSGSSVRCLKD